MQTEKSRIARLMRITAPSEYSNSPPAYSRGEKISRRPRENFPQKYRPAIRARMPETTRPKRFQLRSTDKSSSIATRHRASETHGSGEASRPPGAIDSYTTLNCGLPSTVTGEPPLVVSGRMEYFVERRSRRLTQPLGVGPPPGPGARTSSMISRPAITRIFASPLLLARYQREPRL